MIKLIGLGLLIWLLIFLARVWMIGGLDLGYRDPGNELLKSYQTNLAEVINKILPYPQSRLLSGILLGVNQIPHALVEDLKTTGTIHIAVVSGQNLSILAGFIMSLASFLGRKRTIFLTLFVILIYSLLTGLGVPVIRAAIMATLTYLAVLLGREANGSWVLFLTAGMMLIFNPNWLFSLSFQLSFLATFGVVVVAPIVIDMLNFLPKILREDFGVTLSAHLLTLPVIASNFGTISLIGTLVNSLILWVIPIVMIIGGMALFLGYISLLLGKIIGLVPGVLITYLIYCVEFFAKLPLSSIYLGQTSILIWIGYYLVLIGGLIRLNQRSKVRGQNYK